jgi:CBS domain containing-hemolysin-like protein
VAASFDEAEIRSMITQSRREGRLGREVGELAAGALTFEQHAVENVLLPMDSVVTVPRTTTPRQLEAVVAEHGFSRYPVRDDDGALAGFVHVKDALGVEGEARDRPIPEDSVVPLVPLTPGSRLPDVLAEMRTQGAHLGVVGPLADAAGVVALEDVLELLIGDVRDAAVELAGSTAAPRTGAEAGAGAGGR